MRKLDPEIDRSAPSFDPQPEDDDHPSPEELIAYRGRQLSEAGSARIRSHLLACAACRALLLELADLETDPGAGSATVSPLELDRAWQRQRRLQRSRRRRFRMSHAGWGLAAALLIAAGTLALQLRDLRQTSAAFFDHDLPRVIVEDQSRRSQGEAIPVLELAADRPALVILLLPEDLPYDRFRAAFLAQDGRTLITRDGLSASEALVIVSLRPGELRAGAVRVVVSAQTENGYQPIREYALRIRPPS